MTISKLSGTVDRNRANRDALSFAGALEGLTAPENWEGAVARVDLCGVVAEFALNKRGSGKGACGAMALRFKKATQQWLLTVKLSKGQWADAFAEAGLTATATGNLTLPVAVEIAGQKFGSEKVIGVKTSKGRSTLK